MKKIRNQTLSTTVRLVVMAILVISMTLGLGQTALAAANPAPVDLGMAAPFVILTKTGVTNVPTSAISGNMGASPIAATGITGFSLIADSTNTFATSSQVTGKVYAANYAAPTPSNLTTAVSNMEAAYTDAAGRTLPDFTELYAGDLSGKTLAPGLYKWGTGVLITSDVTLAGPADAVWIFQISGDLTMGSGAKMVLSGGALPANIFWQVGGGTGVEVGTTAHVEGTILAAKAINFRTGASLNGRALAQTEVTLDKNVLVIPGFNDTNANADTTGVYRPGNGMLFLKIANTSGVADASFNYGMANALPVMGDWNGDGVSTPGVYYMGMFYLRNSNTSGIADTVISFGMPGDQPVVGDWNGDGTETIGIYRSSVGKFFLRNSNTSGVADLSFSFGNPGDVALAGDWNGDGTDTTGIFRPSNAALYLKNANTTGIADLAIHYGIPGDKPVTGDWNGDGIDTIGIFRNGVFHLRNSNTLGTSDLVFSLGLGSDMPVAGKWGLP